MIKLINCADFGDSTTLQMPRYDKRAHWPYDRVDEGLTKTAGQGP